MGQTLSRKPISQQQGFATMNTASSPNAPDQSQYQGFTTPTQATASPDMTMQTDQAIQGFQTPSVMGSQFGKGFGGFRQRMMDY